MRRNLRKYQRGNFSMFPAGTTGASAPPLVSAEGAGYTNSGREDIFDPVVTGLRFLTSAALDYQERRCNAGGSYSSGFNRGTWLDQGVPGQVWVIFNRTAGLTNWDSLNSGVRYNMGTQRTYQLERPTPGSDTISGQFQFYDAASGGNLLDSGLSNQTWTATQTVDPCPICCFTPETPILMASGLEVPIDAIKEGDEIQTANGPEVVKEIITRVNRVMYRITFADGTYVNASEDHPLDVAGTARSINPIIDYKHIGLPEKLEIGDVVTTTRGNQLIVSIEQIDYPGMVYTLGNVMFYANGVLVY